MFQKKFWEQHLHMDSSVNESGVITEILENAFGHDIDDLGSDTWSIPVENDHELL